MGLPTPQFGVPLTPNQINPELSWYPIYGVTPDDKYVPIAITENGQLSIGSVTITGPVTVTDIVIKGVDPANSFVSEDVDVLLGFLGLMGLMVSMAVLHFMVFIVFIVLLVHWLFLVVSDILNVMRGLVYVFMVFQSLIGLMVLNEP